MSRKYSAWASNQPVINIDSSMMKLTTITGNEQEQLKTMDRVESIPHMYMNIDAPPPPVNKIDARMVQPTVMLSRQNSSFFAPPTGFSAPMNSQTKLWPNTKSTMAFDSTSSSSSKRPHKHKHHHHHHHHHHGKHHHHHSHRHRAKSAETIRNRQHQAIVSPTKMIITNPQYIEQDQQQQQQQQQQPMIVYREVGNGESYTVDPNGLATVPYTTDNETTFVDDQQAPIFAYTTDQQALVNDGNMQQVFFTPEQETNIITQSTGTTCCSPMVANQPCIQEIERIYLEEDRCIVHQTDPFTYLPQQQQQQQTPQVVYCTDPNLQFVQQQQQQQQVVCLDNSPTTAIQPTIINQIPVFNPLSTTTAASPSIITVPQTSLQRTASIIVHPQQQQQSQPVQIIQQNPQIQPGQYLQIASPTPQIIQTVQSTPQILYQRPYDPVVIPAQNQQIAVNNSPLVALSQPSYAPTRLASATSNTQTQGPTMFRHALLRTVADRTGVLSTIPSTNSVQLVQPSTTAAAVTTPNLMMTGNARQSSVPIIPLTPGGLLIPFQSSSAQTQTSNVRRAPGIQPRLGGTNYPSTLRNFNDIRQQLQEKRLQILQTLQAQEAARAPSPPVLTATTVPYSSGNIFASSAAPYSRPGSTGLPYTQPSIANSYQSFRQ